MTRIEQVLCPVDFSDTSRHALDCTVRTAEGGTCRQVLRQAEADASDLIVMGVHGRGGVDLLVFGSTTHHVVRSAHCPVLIVRSAGT